MWNFQPGPYEFSASSEDLQPAVLAHHDGSGSSDGDGDDSGSSLPRVVVPDSFRDW